MWKDPEVYAGECYCYNLRHITAQVTKFYDQHLKKAGITSQQFSTLENIRVMEPASVTDISKKMGLDRTSLSRNLKILKNNALIDDHEGVGRSRQVVLSEHGREVLELAEELWKEAQAEFEAIFDEGQLQQLKTITEVLNRHFRSGK